MLKLDEKAHKVMEASRNLRNSSSRGRGFEGPVPQGILKKSDWSEAVCDDRSAYTATPLHFLNNFLSNN